MRIIKKEEKMGQRIAKVISISLIKRIITNSEQGCQFLDMRIKITFADQKVGHFTIIETSNHLTEEQLAIMLALLPSEIQIPVNHANPPYLLIEDIENIEGDIFENEEQVKIIQKMSRDEIIKLAQRGLDKKE